MEQALIEYLGFVSDLLRVVSAGIFTAVFLVILALWTGERRNGRK